MSDVTDNTEDTGDDQEIGERSLLGKAKDAASNIDVKDMAGKAKDAASNIDVKDMAGKAKDAAVGVKDRVTDFVGDHEDQIGSAIHKTGQFVDEKLTRNKFSDKIERAEEAARGVVHKVGGSGEGEPDREPEGEGAGA